MELTYIVKSADESIKQILKNEFNMSDRFILKLKNHKSIFINNVSVCRWIFLLKFVNTVFEF